MKVGSVIQFKPDIFKDKGGINPWARRAAEKGTCFNVLSVSDYAVTAEPVDDEEILSMLIKKTVTMKKENIQEMHSRETLKEMRNAGSISDSNYLNALLTAKE